MTPIPRSYCNWDAVHRVLETIPSMLAEGAYTTTAAMVHITIARHANQQEGLTLASYETFFNEAGIPRSTVKYTLKKLAEAGYLEHVKDTYAYKFGPKVQTFTAEKATTATTKKYNNQQTSCSQWCQVLMLTGSGIRLRRNFSATVPALKRSPTFSATHLKSSASITRNVPLPGSHASTI